MIKYSNYNTKSISLVENFSDLDGNVYTPVTIGSQVWMKENLKTTKYNDGTPIANKTLAADWMADTAGAYCWYENNIANKTPYGALYNGYALNSGKLAPKGWRIANGGDYARLIAYLGGSTGAGAKVKEVGTTHWTSDSGSSNSSGLTIVGSGVRVGTDGSFSSKDYTAYLWEATRLAGNRLYSSYWYNSNDEGANTTDGDANGLAVRCIRDSFWCDKVRFYGDSIINGLYASDSAHMWRNIIGVDKNIIVVNVAQNGKCLQNTPPTDPAGGTAVNLRDQVSSLADADTNYVESIMIALGVNDTDFTYPAWTVDTFKKQYIECLQVFNTKGFYGKRIALISPYYTNIIAGVNPPEQRKLDFVQATKEVAAQFSTQYVDVYTYIKNNGGDTLLHTDGLHLNDAGHAAVAAITEAVVS